VAARPPGGSTRRHRRLILGVSALGVSRHRRPSGPKTGFRNGFGRIRP
jgi:hypothetical protein